MISLDHKCRVSLASILTRDRGVLSAVRYIVGHTRDISPFGAGWPDYTATRLDAKK